MMSVIRRTVKKHKIGFSSPVQSFERQEAFQNLVARYGIEKAMDKMHVDVQFVGDEMVLIEDRVGR